MSGVWGWFGGQSAQKRKDTPKNAILGLRSQLEMLQKRERHLQNQMDEQDAIARKNVSTNKNGTVPPPPPWYQPFPKTPQPAPLDSVSIICIGYVYRAVC